METAPQHGFVRINNLRLHYLDWGGDGKPLILLHGFSSNAAVWQEFVANGYIDLKKYRVIALDQRGHGESEWADDYAITEFIDDLAKFAKSLNLDSFDLLGHSMGARHAMAYAGEHPDSLRHLILVDFGPEVDAEGAASLKSFAAPKPIGFSSLEKALAYFQSVSDRTQSDEAWVEAVHASLRRNYAGQLVWRADPELTWLASKFAGNEVPYIWEMIARAQVPTLIVRGESSAVLGQKIMQRMLDTMPFAASAEIADAGHSVPQDNPEEFWSRVNSFLGS